MEAARPAPEPGQRVRIAAADEFYQFVDGWEGDFVGYRGGHPEILCQRPDGDKFLLVPLDQLRTVNP